MKVPSYGWAHDDDRDERAFRLGQPVGAIELIDFKSPADAVAGEILEHGERAS